MLITYELLNPMRSMLGISYEIAAFADTKEWGKEQPTIVDYHVISIGFVFLTIVFKKKKGN